MKLNYQLNTILNDQLKKKFIKKIKSIQLTYQIRNLSNDIETNQYKENSMLKDP
jgi:hypothetical protein